MSLRDDFSAETKRILALRAGGRCSNPGCGALTSGPKADPAKALNLGVAAHITAAAPGGCRYDERLKRDERSHADNGIWLCQNCAKLVDNDERRFTVSTLRDWKHEAEARAVMEIGVPSASDSARRFRAAELEILVAAADRGDIWLMRYDQIGDWVRAGARNFAVAHDPGYAARFVDALEDLQEERLVRHKGGQWYQLTGAGFEIARDLRSRLEKAVDGPGDSVDIG